LRLGVFAVSLIDATPYAAERLRAKSVFTMSKNGPGVCAGPGAL
jgi:hypothetical protein